MATCKKPLIAGLNGHTVGIGVTILPLFDYVIATENSSFSTPYVKIGQIPEGYAIFSLTNKINQNLVCATIIYLQNHN